MKIAIQFYGHLRTFEQTYKSVQQNLFDRYDCDVFIHTWDELQHRTVTWYDQGDQCDKVDDAYIEKIHEYYDPKSLLIESQVMPEDDIVLQSHVISDAVMSLTGIKYLFYSQYKANELRKEYQKKTNTEYDYVLVIRPDVLLKNPLCIEAYITQQEFVSGNADRCRFCANNIDSHSQMPILLRSICATDILYFGRPEVVDQTCLFYEKIKNNNDFLEANFSNPEGLVYRHNKEDKIETVLICYTDHVDWAKVRFDEKQLPLPAKGPDRGKSIVKIIQKNLLSLLPYFLVKSKIKKLKKNI